MRKIDQMIERVMHGADPHAVLEVFGGNVETLKTRDGFSVGFDGNIVEVVKTGIPESNFLSELERANDILFSFRCTGCNDWGTDGVGLVVNRDKGLVQRNISKVDGKSWEAGKRKLGL